MKKKFIAIVLVSMLTGCSGSSNIVEDLAEVPVEESESLEIGEPLDMTLEDIISGKDFSAMDDIEVDENISLLPTSLAFAQVQRMMYYPHEYDGVRVKVTGYYYKETIEALDISIEAILLMDETNCCQGYFELELGDEVQRPAIGEVIMVAGTYKAMNDGQYDYGLLEVSDYIFE